MGPQGHMLTLSQGPSPRDPFPGLYSLWLPTGFGPGQTLAVGQRGRRVKSACHVQHLPWGHLGRP